MITPENITRSQAQRLVKLIQKETRCEVMARLACSLPKDWGNYAEKQIEYQNKIRKLLFGTSDLVKLGIKFKLLSPRKKK